MKALVVFSVALASTVSFAFAGRDLPVGDGETVYIQLGDGLVGELSEGSGTVFANFNAVEGTLITVRVEATPLEYSNRAPVLLLDVLDGSGSVLDLGNTVFDGGPIAEILEYEVLESANYTLVITAIGTRDLRATTSGQVPGEVVTGTIEGTVVNALTGEGIDGVNVWVGPFLLITTPNGGYSGDFPYDGYDVTYEATYFEPYMEEDVIIFPLLPTRVDVALDPVAPVVVESDLAGDAVPDGTVDASAMVVILDGSFIESYAWTQIFGTTAVITGENTETATVSLASASDYKATLYHILAEPPIDPDDLPPEFPPPPEEFPGGLQNRFYVVGLNPFSLEETGLVTLQLDVTTTSGVYTIEVEVHTNIPWKPTAAIENVAIGIPVLLHGKDQASYDWAMTPPDLSDAVLVDPLTQNPEFVPDVPGEYELTVMDIEAAQVLDFTVYAGNWRGVIVGQDDDGRPVADASCLSCHENLQVGNAFVPWAQTGHAEIFTDNLNTSTHYGTNCFPCHTVGFDTELSNNGFDDAPDYQAFLDSGLLNNPGDNWTTMLDLFPAAAQRANIQCENCHGPQDKFPGQASNAHRQYDPRITLASDMCATCHGEPLRHARYQQWQLSRHANYELAVDEGESGNCSRCHTANGFLAWLPILLGDEPGDPLEDIEVTWEPDDVHPQTCQTCHDPHSIGTSSGSDTDATVRISGNTPMLIAGFRAYGVGRGAVCMTCHNSRRGLRNDSTFDQYYQTSEAARAPHGSAQTDVLMGENGYLVTTGIRGNHSFVTDSCVNCHMEQTPPPDILAYNQGGTNHTFFARLDICTECHVGGFEAEAIQSGVQETLDELQALVEIGLFDLIAAQLDLGNTIDLNGEVMIVNADDIDEIVFGEYRGRQSITVTLIGVPYGPYRLTDVDVLDPMGVILGELYDFADPNLIKAGWNYNLVGNDGSLGLHNPSFAYQVLGAAIGGLDPLAPINYPDWMDWDGPSLSQKRSLRFGR